MTHQQDAVDQAPQESRLADSVENAQIVEQSNKMETGPLFFGMAIVIVSTLLTTYVTGANWGWWGPMRTAMREAGVAIQHIPREFGEWEAATDDEKLDEASVEQLELSDYVVRRYTNKITGETVALIFMVGPTGRLTAHTPQICFGGRNFKMDSRPIPVSFSYEGDEDSSENQDALAKIVFRNQSVSGGAKLFYYGVSTGQNWMPITDTSRFDLRHKRFLYKLQVEAFVRDDQSGEDDVIARFLRDFIPLVRPGLVECF